METPDPAYLDFGLQWSLARLADDPSADDPEGKWPFEPWRARCAHCDFMLVGHKVPVVAAMEDHVWRSHMTLSARLYIKGYEEAIGRHRPDPSKARVALTEAGRAYLKGREGL